VSRQPWSTRSAAARSSAGCRSQPTQTATTENEIGVLRFDEWGKKQVSRLSRDEINQKLAELTDPSNYAGRCADAQAAQTAFLAAHLTGWAGTTGCSPKNDIERRALADAQTAAHRDFTFAEKMQIVERLRQR
jgi:hypothetical protein